MYRPASPILRVLLPLCVFALSLSSAGAAVLRVSRGAPGPAHDGATWQTAYTVVQAAISAAAPNDEIWVAAGTYGENLTLKEGVSLYGGFAGTETERAQRNWNAHQTILDGGNAASVMTASGAFTPSTVVSGFVIRNGRGGSSTGGGMTLTGGAGITVANNTFYRNSSARGGAMDVFTSSPRVCNNVFLENSSSVAAAMYMWNASPAVVNNTFSGNTAYNTSDPSNPVQRCAFLIAGSQAAPLFANNIETRGSGFEIDAAVGSAPVFRNNCITGETISPVFRPYNGSVAPADPTGSLGNIAVDPMFASWAHRNLHIQPASLCRGAGDATSVDASDVDMDGQPRLIDGHVDIGADQSDGTMWTESPRVVYLSTSGNDLNDGLSWETAKRTIWETLKSVQAGDSVWISAGTYDGSYVVIPNGVAVYGGFMGREKTVSERDPRANVTWLKGGVQVGESSGNTQPTVLDGFKLTGLSGWGPAIQALGTATLSNNLITGIRMVDGYSAIGLFGAGTVLANNTIRGNSADGAFTVLVSGGPSMIANNLIVANANGGISIGSKSDATPSTVTVVNNTIASNGVEGALVISNAQSSLTLANNIIAFNGLGVSAPSGFAGALVRHNNCVYRNGTADWGGLPNPGTENGNIAVDPQLASLAGGDFRLLSASPCVNSGNAAYVTGTTDAEGNPRVVGASVDMGALESTGQDPTPRARVVFVSPTGLDANDGESWITAKATVKAGLDLAALTGGEVWVTAGTYKENLTLPPFVSLYGGFIGTETQRNQRDPAAHETILDGQKRTTTLTISAPGGGIEVDGFTIQNGSASYQHGGNVTLSGTRAAIRRCVIRNGVNTQGAGVYVTGGSPTIASCTFIANGTLASSAVYVSSGEPLIANSVFDGQMTSQGYAIQTYMSNAKVINNTVIRSKYQAVTSSGGTPTIANNILAWNGGGISALGTVNPVVSHNCIWSSGAAYTGTSLGAGQASAYIRVNPTMADPTAGNVHIRPDSPCRNTGDNAYADPLWSDMDGQARINDGIVDIGADESTGAAYPPLAVYVKTDGDDAKDGRSWANAKKTIAAGITAAKAILDAEVWVAAGTYTGSVSLPTGQALYGGFAGTETQRSQRDWVKNVTTIDAAGATGNIVTVSGTPDAGGVLDGFALVNSTGNNMANGLAVTNCSPAIRNCTITGVKSSAYGAVNCTLTMGGSVTIEDCVVSGNTARNAAGLYAYKGSVTILRTKFANNTALGASTIGGNGGAVQSAADHLVIQGCTFTDNVAVRQGTTGGMGGAVLVASPAYTISGNVFRGNSARYGGGVANPTLPTPGQRVTDNTFLANSAEWGAGAAFAGTSDSGSAIVVSNNTFAANGGAHGAVDIEQGGITLANNIFAFNASGVYVPARFTARFRSNCFWQNAAFDVSELTGVIGTDGNFAANPRFAGILVGNVHIQPDSPCRNRSDAAYLQEGETDVDGQPRVQDGKADVGSDESDGTVWEPVSAVAFVSPSGNDANDGSSWAKAKRTIQAGVNSGSNEVWVAAGAYMESVTLKPFVSLYGGFSGREAVREQRDVNRNATVIDGEGHRWLVAGTDIPFGTVDGFTLRNAYRGYYGNPSAPAFGGGLALTRCGVTVRNNTFLNNTSGSGGALALNDSTGEVARNRFQGNTGMVSGGAIWVSSTMPLPSGAPRIVDNVFLANHSARGAGVYLNAGTLANNTFVGNAVYAPFTGSYYGTVTAETATPVVANNIITGNDLGYTAAYSTLTGPAFHHNCVYGNGTDYLAVKDPTGTNGNIRQDPMLADARTGNYHLLAGSPCIDAGDPAMTAPGDADADGGARRTGATIDIGADEYDGRFTSPTPSAVIRVKPSGSDANDGASWATAKQTVQAAMDQAALTGGEVWVAGGLYSERVTVPAMVGLYGGFGGYEELKSQRKWAFNTTILDGGQLGTVVTIPDASPRAVLDGFTIQNGRAKLGGGVHCAGGNAEIAHNVFRGNEATTTNGSAAGGGLYIRGANVTVISNLFASNSATSVGATGGGVCVAASGIRFVNNTVVRNTAAGVGGGVRLSSTSDALAVANNVFAYNSSALSTTQAATDIAVLRNNCFYSNVRDADAGTDRTTVWGNIRRDPRFVDPYQDFRLRADSPCADAGDTALVGAGAMDLSGVARVWGARVDIGAYESTVAPTQTGAAVVRVSPTGSDAKDGSSWANAKRTIGAALAAVRSPGEVWAAAGTYQERVTVPSGVALLGGFTGTETIHTPADPANHVTTLDGGQNGPVVVLAPNATPNTRLEDLTITNGWYPGAGGVFCQSGSPALRRLVVANNNACGLYVLGGSPTVEDCAFGQGSYVTSKGGAPLIVRCTFDNAGASGLGMDGGSATVLQSKFRGCGVWATNGYLTMRNCEVRGASNGYTGGGVYLARGTIAMRDCVIAGNMARSDYGTTYGGGVYLTNAKGTLANNTIVGNGATEGGGIYAAASVVTLANNILVRNSSGIAVSASASGILTLRNNCIFGNGGVAFSNLPDPTGANGNIAADPQLQMPVSGPLHIQPGSPCRDAGDSAFVAPGDTDVDGEARVQGARVDIGADESDGSVHPDGAGTVVRVRPDGNDANDGSSWSAAKRTLQAAVDAAAAQGGGQVWASGTFSGWTSLAARVEILGGFAGDELRAEQRDPAAHPTILDGMRGAGDLVTIPSSAGLSALDGLTLQNAVRGVNASYGTSYSVRNCRILRMTEAGILGPSASATITGTRISGCMTAISTGPSSLIAGNRITGCFAGYGSVVSAGGALRFVDNIIAGNASTMMPSYGGFGRDGGQPLMALATATGVFANNTVVGNEAVSGAVQLGRIAVENNIFAGNSVAAAFATAPSSLKSNAFWNNDTDVTGTASPVGSSGNFRGDPGFLSLNEGDLRLSAGSPCVDAGSPATVGGADTDADGAPRVQRAGVDIGALEWDGVNRPATSKPVLHVSPTGNDANDGSSWAMAKRTIQASLDAGPADVWVAAGTYDECVTAGPWSHVEGGYKGDDASPSERDVAAYPTTIRGVPGGPVMTVRCGRVTGDVDGFTVTGGHSTPGTVGVGITVDGSTVTVARCRITGNDSSSTAGAGMRSVGSRLTLQDSDVTANTQGGVYAYAGSTLIFRCRVSDNTGTAITAVLGANQILSNVISNNKAVTQYGISAWGVDTNGAASVVANNLICGNEGGAIYAAGVEPTVRITGNTIVGNVSSGGFGAVEGLAAWIVANNIIAGNTRGLANVRAGASVLSNCVYDNVQGNYTGMADMAGTFGNIQMDPMFISAATGDYHLAARSPCIDRGDPTVAQPSLFDLDGNRRVQGAAVDMGAYESTPLRAMAPLAR